MNCIRTARFAHLSRRKNMAARTSKGILSDHTNPEIDADVIMTAAAVGYAAKRLSDGKNCAFAAEVEQNYPVAPVLTLPPLITDYSAFQSVCDLKSKQYLDQVAEYQKRIGSLDNLRQIAEDDIDFTKGWILLDNAINRINAALGIAPEDAKQKVVVDASPNYGEAGVVWIVGETGNLSLENQNRYLNSPLRSRQCAQLINYIQSDEFAGYKGKGAYTGMSARQDSAAYIYSTFRGHPSTAFGNRWLPSDPSLMKIAIEPGNSPIHGTRYIATWGIIGDNALATKVEDEYKMKYQDRLQSNEYEDYVVGYTHGMIQAIYDVAQSKIDNNPDPGTAFEIGLKGKTKKDPSTTKMASCFYCALFVEANGKPASSIHLGLGESWAPAYTSKDVIRANQRINDAGGFDSLDLENSIKTCNEAWARYCSNILRIGFGALTKSNTVTDDHLASLTALQKFIEQMGGNDAANLILDSATVHQKIAVRIVRTLNMPQAK
jgi:hypothetical protein